MALAPLCELGEHGLLLSHVLRRGGLSVQTVLGPSADKVAEPGLRDVLVSGVAVRASATFPEDNANSVIAPQIPDGSRCLI